MRDHDSEERRRGTDRGKPSPPRAPASQHAVLLHFKLSDDQLGAAEECEEVFKLEARLEAALSRPPKRACSAGTSSVAARPFSYMYGTDKDRMWAAIETEARKCPLRPAHALLRPGPPEIPARRIDLWVR